MEQLKCQYCGKICKNNNSLRNHERLCDCNPNKQEMTWLKGGNLHKYLNKLKTGEIKQHNWHTKIIHKGNIQKKVDVSEIEQYLKDGWVLGYLDENKPKANFSGRIGPGKASNEYKENLRKERISKTMKLKKCGGKRHGSGRGKKGFYQGIFCDSSWELAFVYYHIKNNIPIKRCDERRKYFFEDKEHTYIPDFIVNDVIYEIKGYQTSQSQAKSIQNPDIVVLTYKDMEFYINYVKEDVGANFCEILYEK